MSISPVGNVVYVNQQTANVTPLQGNQNTRFDLQNVMAQQILNDKEQEVQEVRPTEQNQEVDPDREHQKEKEEQQTRKELDKKNDEEEQNPYEVHSLDVVV